MFFTLAVLYKVNLHEVLYKIPISSQYRNPIRVGSDRNFAPIWSKSSKAADVHTVIL